MKKNNGRLLAIIAAYNAPIQQVTVLEGETIRPWGMIDANGQSINLRDLGEDEILEAYENNKFWEAPAENE